jgi:hypothetical protein
MMATILDLPTELLVKIFDNVIDDYEYYRLRLVCKAFWSIIEPSIARCFRSIDYSNYEGPLPTIFPAIAVVSRPELGLLTNDINLVESLIESHENECVLCVREVSKLCGVVSNARLPGDTNLWLKKLVAGDESAALKLLLISTPNLKQLRLEFDFDDSAYLYALDEVARASDPDGKASYLLNLEELSVATGGDWRDVPLHQFPSILRLPSLRKFKIEGFNAEAYEDDGNNHWSQLSEDLHLTLESLQFNDCSIGPKYLTDCLAVCRGLRVFEYEQLDAGADLDDVSGSFEPPELRSALMQHKSTLESLKLCDITTFIEDYGLCRSDDFTIGSLTDFSAMERLDIEQSILLGDPDTFCHDCLQGDCLEHHLYRRPYSSRQPKLYRLRNVLPPSIRELTIRRVQPDISGHLIELAEVHEASFPHLTKIHLMHRWYSDNSCEVVRGILQSVGDAFGSAVSLSP